MNNADFGLTIQKAICDIYSLEINEIAQKQFQASYNAKYLKDYCGVIIKMFEDINDEPVEFLTFEKIIIDGRLISSPHNFVLKSGNTLSIRTNKKGEKVAPRVLGQAGYPVLNEYFGEIYGKQIADQNDIKDFIYNHIDEALPLFVDYFFKSDYTVLINLNEEGYSIIKKDELIELVFLREDFSFTRQPNMWKESTTLKYKNISIAEIQIHKNRTFKFRFIISAIKKFLLETKVNNETIGMSAEYAICDLYKLQKPNHLIRRAKEYYINLFKPKIISAFEKLPEPILYTGSEKGNDGSFSKSSYDFLLKGDYTLSLKTNKNMICPPEVGQPGSKTFLRHFGQLYDEEIEQMDDAKFKWLVINKIDKMIPIYIEHLFDSDYLLWIRINGNDLRYTIHKKVNVDAFFWDINEFSFTRNLDNWNESNTVKYRNITLGEFQVHNNRNCYKYRFNMKNLVEKILIQ